MPSNRSFGFLFAAIFAAAALWLLAPERPYLFIVLVALSLATLVAAVFSPKLLTPFNKLWFDFGQLLGEIVSPIVLGIIFFGIMTPVAVVSRLTGRDPLRLRQCHTDSCWVERTNASPDPASFKNQF
jgi:hypothetical protein